MKRWLVALVVALVVAPQAAAKGDVAVTVCGVSGCAPVEGGPPVRSALAWPDSESVPPPPVAEYYSLRFVDGSGSRVGYYVPGADLIAVIDAAGARTGVDGVATWTAVPPAAAEMLGRAVDGLRPFPPPELAGAEVGFEAVDDPRGYLQLFELDAEGAAVPAAADWSPIVLHADRPNPWTDGTTRLSYSPSTKLLRRGQEILPLSAEIAQDLDAREPLGGAGGESWTGTLVGAAAALVVVGLAVLVRRQRRSVHGLRLGHQAGTARR